MTTAASEAYLPTRLRRLARIVNAERRVTEATAGALQDLADQARDQLAADGWTATVLDTRAPEWRAAIAERLLPVVADVFDQGYRAELRDPAVTAAVMPSGEPLDGSYGAADHLATRYLADVQNRLVGVADDVFRVIADSLEAGRQATFTLADGTTVVGESIPELAKRVEAALSDGQRWRNRGTVVARTEVIGANNAGAHAAAFNNAELFGSSSAAVIKEWLNTQDHRTRETHQAAGGQMVLGLDTPFQVGSASLQQPGDPSGPAREVVQCRCTTLYHYPGDPGYDEKAALLGATPAAPAALAAPVGATFSSEQFETMRPASQWTEEKQQAIKASLTATPEGRALHDVLDRFQDGGSIARLRTSIEKRLAGTAVPEATAAKVDALLGAIREAPTDWAPETLYRGMTVSGKLENVLAKYVPGEPLDLSLTSFSADRKVATRFQQMTAKASGTQTRVMVELVGTDKRVLPIQNLARDSRLFREKEWVSAGRFRIVEVKKSPSGGMILRIEQEAAL